VLKIKLKKEAQIKFYNVTAVPMLVYGSENWDLNRSERKKQKLQKSGLITTMTTFCMLLRITVFCFFWTSSIV
jgi:hypothetical protein